jgi:hypothetical protein
MRPRSRQGRRGRGASRKIALRGADLARRLRQRRELEAREELSGGTRGIGDLRRGHVAEREQLERRFDDTGAQPRESRRARQVAHGGDAQERAGAARDGKQLEREVLEHAVGGDVERRRRRDIHIREQRAGQLREIGVGGRFPMRERGVHRLRRGADRVRGAEIAQRDSGGADRPAIEASFAREIFEDQLAVAGRSRAAAPRRAAPPAVRPDRARR